MKIKTVNNYYTDENTYIVYDENTKNGLVIDPGYINYKRVCSLCGLVVWNMWQN